MTLDKNQRVTLLRAAISAGGGMIAFARSLGVSHQAVYQWIKRGYVPPFQATKIDALYHVPRRDLVDPAMLEMLAIAESR